MFHVIKEKRFTQHLLFCVLTALDVCGSSRCRSYSWPWALCYLCSEVCTCIQNPAAKKHHSLSLVWLLECWSFSLRNMSRASLPTMESGEIASYSPLVWPLPPSSCADSVLLCLPYSQFPTFLHLCWLWMWFQTTGPQKILVCRAQTVPYNTQQSPLWFWRAHLTQTTGKA